MIWGWPKLGEEHSLRTLLKRLFPPRDSLFHPELGSLVTLRCCSLDSPAWVAAVRQLLLVCPKKCLHDSVVTERSPHGLLRPTSRNSRRGN
ncbi:hypothetical protein TREES_T100007824 [Tupaia chinensis]|uniref:Uncharacterized protein n=1 Tax=Tupaia chinensis TaxID=246437 RepID=L9KH14_TUPCH|nr:hypothetical protein TREES_T100007824 [Tupaia chinensis]